MTERRLPKTAVENLVEDLASKANADLSNLDATGQAKFDAKANISLTNTPYTTNRILEIPQDIKLELNNGTLTLKAGSSYYKCDGNFTKTTTSQDYSITNVLNGYRLVFFTGNGFDVPTVMDCISGTSEPATGNKWFNTSNNILYSGGSGNWQQKTNYSLPLAIITVSDGTIASIDQVFSGFGYIGSTVFVLPRVKVQIPDGRNADYTCKSIIATTTEVNTFTPDYFPLNDAGAWLRSDGTLTATNQFYYDSDKNQIIFSADNKAYTNICIAKFNWVDGKIASWLPFTVDSVLNSNLSNLSAAGQAKFDAKADKNIPVIGIPATSGAVTLADNTVYSGTMSGAMTFVLPTVTDATQYHQIKAMLYLPVVTIDWGTTHYIGGDAPDVSEAGNYMIYWDYVPALSAWTVGAMKVG